MNLLITCFKGLTISVFFSEAQCDMVAFFKRQVRSYFGSYTRIFDELTEFASFMTSEVLTNRAKYVCIIHIL